MPLPPRISLVSMDGTTQFAPLVALGFFVREYDLLSPIYSRLQFTQATHTEHPIPALIDLWVSMLAGCRSVWQINTKIRPDLTLAQAWGRPRFAEQSTVARVLDVCSREQVDQLREGVTAIYHWIGQAPRHDWERAVLLVDIDLTGLPAGRRAEGSTKGYFSIKKGARGRQLCRIGATDYDESVASLLYPGNTLSEQVLQEAVWTLETTLRLSPTQRQQTCLRLDGGFGTDENLDWVLQRDYQLIAKGKSGRRAGAWGRQVQHWQELRPDQRWVALAPKQLQFGIPTRTLVVRWRNSKGQLKHALYVVTDLHSPLAEVCHLYDLRGGAEVDIRDDKQGLLLTHRRKRAWHAQEMIVLLNDLAHNFISAFRRIALLDTSLAGFGPYRLVQDVFNIPGEVVIQDERLVELHLLNTHPYAAIMAEVLPRLWQ